MTNEPKKSATPNDLEYLDLEQAANICCVSVERFGKWIEKGVVPVINHHGKLLIRSHDLIQHLIRHNIPIPDRLLQGNNKKILFILTEEAVPQAVTSEIIWALYRLRKRTPYIFDFVRYDKNIELKIITFRPDIIFLLQKETVDLEPEKLLRKMVNGTTPVYAFATDRPINLDQYLNE
jgi:hypothetical protein